MKISFFIFNFMVISTFSLSSAQSPVLDTDQKPLVTGIGYYILPAVSGRGGGVTLSPTTLNQTCPLDVAQENNEQRNGLPLNFVLAIPNRGGVIRESADLNIRFSGAKTCGRPAVWRVENVNGQRVVSSGGTVGNPGGATISNWFKIEKYENDYKIVFCPTVCNTCRPACGEIGSTIAKNGRRSLLLSNDPLKVKFKKAGDMAHKYLILITIFVSFTVAATGRLITTTNSSTNLVHDGVHDGYEGILRRNTFLSLFSTNNESELCEQTYGFMPCTDTVPGNLFLILVYGYLMFLAATYLSTGSELMLEILGPGIVGGLFLPVLGALPDAMLILVSGLSGSSETAQDQVSVGMGLLAGSTVMLLTVIWGTCIIVGKCDLQDSIALDNQDTKGFNLVGSGVSTDIWTSYSAMIMAVSVLPFIVVQFPQTLHSTSGRHLSVLIGLIISTCLLIAYCIYQVYQPILQKRRLAFAKHKHVRSRILRYLKTNAFGGLLDDHGQPNREVLYKIFNSVDVNGDNHLSQSELRALVVGMQLSDINLNEDDAVYKVMKDFDTSGNDEVDFEEFVTGITNWLEEARITRIRSPVADPDTTNYIHDYYEETKRQHYLLGDEGGEDEENAVVEPRWTTIKAVLLLLLGTLIAAIFADPLVDAVDGFSASTSIPSFFISFIVLPLVTNSSESVSAIIFASRKKQRSASLTFSELYGAATMNNLLCLSVFLALVYMRGLTWDFTSEVLVIVIVCIVMGVFGSLRTTFPLWTSFIAFLLYPFSLVLVYVLDYIFGWS